MFLIFNEVIHTGIEVQRNLEDRKLFMPAQKGNTRIWLLKMLSAALYSTDGKTYNLWCDLGHRLIFLFLSFVLLYVRISHVV